MTRWFESERGLVTSLVIAIVVSWVLVAIVWSMYGATVVLVPTGGAALAVVAIGSWMHDFPRVDR